MEPLITLRPKNGLRMVLRRRPPMDARIDPGARPEVRLDIARAST